MSSGPEQDEEKPILDHVIELRSRVLIVLAAVVGIALASFPLSTYVVDPMIASVTDPSNVMVYDPFHSFTIPMNISLMVGVAFSLPLILYEAYQFMAPGLFPDERRLFAIITPSSILLFILGASIAYFFVIPNISDVVLRLGESYSTTNLYLKDVMGFIIKMIAAFGFLFQIPLVLLFAIRIDFVSPSFLQENRLYIFIGFFVISNMVSPDPTMLSQLIVTAVFIVLFEISYRIGFYVTPRTEADIGEFVNRFTKLGPFFSSIGVIIGILLAYRIPLWWITLSTLFGVGIYSSQRFSVSLIEEKRFGNIGLFAPLISPLLGSILLMQYYSVNLDIYYLTAIFVLTAILTYFLEKINQLILNKIQKKARKSS